MESQAIVSHDSTKILFIMGIIAVAVGGCHVVNQYFHKEDDWAGEQALELLLDKAVEYETGIDPHIDLTPGD